MRKEIFKILKNITLLLVTTLMASTVFLLFMIIILNFINHLT